MKEMERIKRKTNMLRMASSRGGGGGGGGSTGQQRYYPTQQRQQLGGGNSNNVFREYGDGGYDDFSPAGGGVVVQAATTTTTSGEQHYYGGGEESSTANNTDNNNNAASVSPYGAGRSARKKPSNMNAAAATTTANNSGQRTWSTEDSEADRYNGFATGTSGSASGSRSRPPGRFREEYKADSSTSYGQQQQQQQQTPRTVTPSETAQKAQQQLVRSFHSNTKNSRRQRQEEKAASSSATTPYDYDGDDGRRAAAELNISDPVTEDSTREGDLSRTTANTSSDAGHNDTSVGDSNDSSNNDSRNLSLHDLCGEAVSEDDLAWRNALYLLSVEPHLAAVEDENGWTPLHICGFCHPAPPTYVVRALLYANPRSCRRPDRGGRLPLHFVAASSGDVESMQLLVRYYPASVSVQDDRGYTPLQLLLRNNRVQLTLERARILLGLTVQQQHTGTSTSAVQNAVRSSLLSSSATTAGQQHVHFRRGEHLKMKLEDLDVMLHKPPPVTTFHHYYHGDTDLDYEAAVESYPQDIQVGLRRLCQWKRSEARIKNKLRSEEKKETDNSSADGDDDERQLDCRMANAAAIPFPGNGQLPIHVLVRRAFIEMATLEVEGSFSNTGSGDYDDNDLYLTASGTSGAGKETDLEVGSSDTPDSETTPSVEDGNQKDAHAQQPLSVQHPHDLLRLFISCYPRGLLCRDGNGMTPLLLVMAENNSLPDLDIVELLLGKRTSVGDVGGFDADQNLPSWAKDMPLHQMSSSRAQYMNAAMIPTPESQQLPLHLAAEELLSYPSLIQTVYDSYPGAVLVQDSYGRTPLHVALKSYRRVPIEPQILSLLFNDRVAQIRDDHGRLPFDLLLESAATRTIPQELPRSWTASTESSATSTSGQSWSVYERFLSTSIAGAAKPTKKSEVKGFLRGLRNLPPWLRKQACSSIIVQDLLVEDMASPLKCALVLLDGLVLVALITVFRIQMEQYVVAQDNGVQLSTWYTFAVYATATMHIVLDITYGLVSTSLGAFRHLCLFNPWRWIDFAAMLVSIGTSALLYSNTSDAKLYALGTASTGLLWLTLLGYLATWSYGISVFVGGLTKVSCDTYESNRYLQRSAILVHISPIYCRAISTDCLLPCVAYHYIWRYGSRLRPDVLHSPAS